MSGQAPTPDSVDRFVVYLKALRDFQMLPPAAAYDHMGAVIVDAVLQAGMNYQRVVEPRVKAIRADHPEARTATGFLELLRRVGPEQLLSWRNKRKMTLVLRMTELLAQDHVDTVDDLKLWLSHPENLKRLRDLSGVGDKTVDYIQALVGIPAVAIDVHLSRLLAQAGIRATGYGSARAIIEQAADRMGVNRTVLDYSLWKFMSERRGA